MSTLRTASMRGRGSSIPKSRGVRRSQRIARTLGAVHPSPRNTKRHPRKQIDLLSESIRQLGFNNPIIVDEPYEILAGHGDTQQPADSAFPNSDYPPEAPALDRMRVCSEQCQTSEAEPLRPG